MAYSIKNGFLFKDGKQVPFKESPNVGGALKAPSLLVMHYTAAQNASGSVSWLCNPAAKASAHLVVDQAGNATQLVNFGRIAWHAGISSWKKRVGCNSFSIGIEMANPGPLTKRADGKFYDAAGKTVPANLVMIAAHKNGGGERPWMVYPAAQVEAAAQIASAITQAYGIKEIVGHEDVAPGRKTDPGPAFRMAGFVSKVLGRA
jgi:N-acetylmuramoyl-L-alanine amidase